MNSQHSLLLPFRSQGQLLSSSAAWQGGCACGARAVEADYLQRLTADASAVVMFGAPLDLMAVCLGARSILSCFLIDGCLMASVL